MLPQDPNNLLNQSRKTRAADPSSDGDLAAALSQIKAKMFVVAFTGDMMFPPPKNVNEMRSESLTHDIKKSAVLAVT